MKFPTSAALGALLLAPAAADAQTAPAAPATGQAQAQTGAQAATSAPTVGATVYDSAGVSIGTIEQVTPQAVVVNTGTAKVSLPPASIGKGPQGLRVAITKAQVDAAARQAQIGQQQQLQASLVPGATVRGAGGAPIGTVKAADAATVTLTTPKGDARLPINGFGMGPNGPIIGLTSAQLDAAIAQAGGAQAGAATGAAAGASTPTTGASTPMTGAASTGATSGAGATGATTQTDPSASSTRRPNG